MEGLILLALLLVGVAIVLPIVAIVRTNRIRNLEMRLAGVEAALHRLIAERGAVAPTAVAESPAPAAERPVELSPPAVAEAAPLAASPAEPPPEPLRGESLEALIGRKWVGWAAILLIFAAASFFLKYAFDNRWIGELGRVSIGVAAGLALVWGGLERHRKGWRYLSQILTGGGIAILYLSVYGAFGYYHLVDARAAFIALVILVAEAHLLSLAYDARAIAVMALLGGFLVPVLLSTGRDQYAVLFSYVVILDLGVLALVFIRQWRWIGSLAYLATQALFWAWYSEHYHPAKQAAVVAFQTIVLLLFLAADFTPRLRGRVTQWGEWWRLVANPFVFYATCYFLLDDEHHDWMAPLALALAIVYAGLARLDLRLRPYDGR
ncbi:MAG TPA: DUF2339 domain-containing protein, partial [Phycisphaerae bacterium]|nr:DUF2339 domain-containing protein [Phycisphaerae bacterium]